MSGRNVSQTSAMRIAIPPVAPVMPKPALGKWYIQIEQQHRATDYAMNQLSCAAVPESPVVKRAHHKLLKIVDPKAASPDPQHQLSVFIHRQITSKASDPVENSAADAHIGPR